MIRPFHSDDAPACSDLIRECVRNDPAITPALQERLLERESASLMLERARLFYLAVHESEGGITGVGGLDLNEIRLLFASPRHRQRGVGRAILEHLEAMVPPAVFADIFVYSAPGAEGFYRNLGFQPRGSHTFDDGGILLATVFMTKRNR